MNTLDPKQLRRELLLEQAINDRLDDLVKRANQTAALLERNNRMEENQLRNLLNVAIESRSIEVVVNFIRYQIARSGSAWGTGRNEFGHTVIADLRGPVRQLADKAIMEASGAPGADRLDFAAKRDEVYVRLMQLYLGYLNRAFYYGKKTGDFGLLKEVSDVR